MYVMDADCLRNGSLFCRFAGKVNIKMKNESITGFCGKCATRTDADAVQEMIDERVRQLERADEEAAAQASRMMEAGTLTREEYDSVLDSARDAKELRTAIRSAITKEMKPRYQAADTAGRQEIAEMLCRLKVDGLTVYEADDFKKWE